MKKVLLVCFLTVALIAGGCASAKTVTVTLPVTTVVPMPGATITLPGSVTTLPPVTVTLPGSVTTIPATTVTVRPITSTVPPCATAPFWDGGNNLSSLHPGGYIVVAGSIQDHTGRTVDQCLSCHVVAQ